MLCTVQLKIPFNGMAILPGLSYDILKSPETDVLRTKRENTATRLKAITGLVPVWQPRLYSYQIELTEAQMEEVNSWVYVRSVRKV